MIFKLPRDPYNEGEYLRKKESFVIDPGLTILVGCNGSGKTTLLNDIKEYCKNYDIPTLHFNNLTDDNTCNKFFMNTLEDMQYVTNIKFSSEGEATRIRIAEFANKIGYFCFQKHKDANEIFILIDALGSGFSIDNIIDVKEQLFHSIIQDSTDNHQIYVIVAANEFELCFNEKCFDVQECKYREFKTYNAYKNFILRSRKKK